MTVALSWSGGKDSALALRALRDAGTEPAALVTTVTEGYERISMHAVRRALLAAQAWAVGVPLVEVRIPQNCPNEVYEVRFEDAFATALAEIETFAFGDLYLEDVRAYREERLARIGRQAVFPLWGRDTAALADEFVRTGFEAVLVCVDPRVLDRAFAGRDYDRALLADLPEHVDPCGENGEFHTFVHAGPIFSRALSVERGPTVERDGFAFSDLRLSSRTRRGGRPARSRASG